MKLSSANINVMVKACRKAAKVLIRDFGEIENLQVSMKGPGDFVTISDKRIEKILSNFSNLSAKNILNRRLTIIITAIDTEINFMKKLFKLFCGPDSPFLFSFI